jgi:hypothetical protein
MLVKNILFGKIFTLPVFRAEFSASKKGKFLERAPLIPLRASVRSFESPNNLASWSFSQVDS